MIIPSSNLSVAHKTWLTRRIDSRRPELTATVVYNGDLGQPSVGELWAQNSAVIDKYMQFHLIWRLTRNLAEDGSPPGGLQALLMRLYEDIGFPPGTIRGPHRWKLCSEAGSKHNPSGN